MIARANGHRGTKRLTDAIAADPQFTRSELERRMRKLARDHKLPRPLCNHTLDAPDHPGLEVDAYFPTHRLVVETDGWATHGTRVLRFTWRQLRDDPRTVADRLQATMSYDVASASRNASSSGSSIE